MRRALRILSVTLITAGIVILADAAVTLAWKEPLSALYGQLRQSAAQDQLDDRARAFNESAAVRDLPPTTDEVKRAGQLAEIYGRQIETGEGIGRIEIPGIGADYVVIEGTGTADLQKGPGHYPDSGLPGEGRTVAIAGHRTTYMAPFRKIADVESGDEVRLAMPYGEFTYEVIQTEIVEPTETDVVEDRGTERVVLTACHPLYSAAQRYVVTAELSDFELRR